MGYKMDAAAQHRLEEYLRQTSGLLRDVRKRESFAIYAYGLFGDGERKSVEPIAARACGAPEAMEAMHAKLLHFVSDSKWDDREVRGFAARYAIEAMEKHDPVRAWIVDDTGFLKQGEHSVGVQRQYTGSAGKITNCQIGVSLAAATEDAHIPLDFELYLPRSWAESPERRKAARIPQEVTFKTKNDLALEMIERAACAKIPGDIVLADSAYGDSCDFRNAVRLLGFDFAVGVEATLKVVRLDANNEPEGVPCSALELSQSLLPTHYRRLRWREGSRRSLSSRFAFRRVKTMHPDGITLADREPLWLIVEWEEGKTTPSKLALTTLPRRMSKKEIVRRLKMRWRTERMYEDLKGELGLDHFEGRSFPGWHHHVSVALWCYAFIVAEQARAFPPSAGREGAADSLRCAA
jgi:SRSO17 transposase